MPSPLKVFIGYDSRERDAWSVCRYTMRKHASIPLDIVPIDFNDSRMQRDWRREGPQLYDALDGRPFSTEFSFARFLVPVLQDYTGWALFCDCDFLWRADVAELLALADEEKAVQVVQHTFCPAPGQKMDGVEQAPYERKNWSSLILWNCGHRAHSLRTDYRGIDLHKINTYPGFFLHTFQWLAIQEIGALPEEWNWLVGHSPSTLTPKAVHFTEGGPWFDAYRNVAYADEWREALHELKQQEDAA